jgi:O-antigen biosynthesis protein
MTESESYYSRLRQDVLEAVPLEAHYVLSVGCASGVTEERLIERGCVVAGIELDPAAAAMARARGLNVVEGNASAVDIAQFGLVFDFIIYADILEHLPDPESVLRRHVQHLRPGGSVYITVPNFRHYSVLWQLALRGEILYVDAGILDRTHVRMTTRNMVLRWIRSCDLALIRVRHRFFGRRFLVLSIVTAGMFREFLAQHIAVVASRPA